MLHMTITTSQVLEIAIGTIKTFRITMKAKIHISIGLLKLQLDSLIFKVWSLTDSLLLKITVETRLLVNR